MVEAPCIRVLIVDDHTLFRQGLRKVLEEFDDVELIAEASNGKEAIGRVDETSPDVVLMDIKMPHMDGVEAIGLIKQRHP
ncbi:MAG: response regulator transcription factor, partial [Chloroflexi bacterium]|nr:response regulator transcription factor [Chloroflexota bacterium]